MTQEITFLHSDHVPRCTGAVDKVFSGYASLQIMAAGGVFLSYDGRAFDLEGAWAWAAWPGPHTIFHRGKGHPYWDHRYLAFSGGRIERWIAQGLLPSAPVRIDRIGALAYEFDRLREQARRQDDAGRTIATHLAEALLLTLRDGGYSERPHTDIVSTVEAAMFEWRFAKADYAGLARQLGMGQSTLRRRYRDATGKPLHMRFLELKLDAARDLIARPGLSIKEIAFRLGYSDVYYFSKQFRAHFGVPPGTFRRSIQHWSDSPERGGE